MLKIVNGIVVLAMLLGLASCDVESHGSTAVGTETADPDVKAAQDKCTNTPTSPGGTDLRYAMSEDQNGTACTTGCQIFQSSSEYCAGLQDDELNHHCAKDERQQAYHDNCSA